MSAQATPALCVVCRAEGRRTRAVDGDYYCESHRFLEGPNPSSLTPSQNGSQNSASRNGFSAPLRLGIRNEERGLAKKGVNRSTSLVPSLKDTPPSLTENEQPEVEQLLDLAAANRLEPVPVLLPPLPDDATETMREVADFFALVHGVRLYAGMEPEVPFACGWVGSKIGRPKPSVHRALRQLEASGVLRCTGSLPGRRKRGTRLWARGGGR